MFLSSAKAFAVADGELPSVLLRAKLEKGIGLGDKYCFRERGDRLGMLDSEPTDPTRRGDILLSTGDPLEKAGDPIVELSWLLSSTIVLL